jgi:hypothetical protein
MGIAKKAHKPVAAVRRTRKDRIMTKNKDDDGTDAPPMETPKRPSLGDLGKKIDAAIRDADAKRMAVDVAKTALDGATKDYGDAVAVVTALHQQYDAAMKDVMSFGGTVHVAG